MAGEYISLGWHEHMDVKVSMLHLRVFLWQFFLSVRCDASSVPFSCRQCPHNIHVYMHTWCNRTLDFQILLYFRQLTDGVDVFSPQVDNVAFEAHTQGHCTAISTLKKSHSPTHDTTQLIHIYYLLFYIFLRRYYYCHLISVWIFTQKRVLSQHKIHDGMTTLFTQS